ncbi:hypothetical protein GGI26_003757 [Coemansia sp. RSA 1358]|uniref:Uncharacterized protein n=1 Tax=Coemansia umbellata TaxID=1424467 RepID=A0ABQ8PLX5_9FUNG|nr:hypothetical protein EDC05_003219 [Coemansia umbellata]KAJ2621914.1 hypothetical protein GGI26_003757 [Coemansia sp. RSA 1358]
MGKGVRQKTPGPRPHNAQADNGTFQLARWTFVHELEEDSSFDPGDFLGQNFFSKVFQYLTSRKERPNVAQKAKRWRSLLKKHLPDYMAVTGIGPITLRALGRVAGYEATKTKTAYINNVKMGLGQHFRRAVNMLLNTHEEKKALCDEMAGRLENEFRRECEARIWLLARQFKEAICHHHPDLSNLGPKARSTVEELQLILSAYPDAYEFAEDSIYYDAKSSPQWHLKAFFELIKFFERRAMKSFQCFPLRTSWVPAHMQIDTRILRRHILRSEHKPKDSDKTSWSKVLDLGCKAVRPQKSKRFWGAIQTDVVSVSIIRLTEDAKKRRRRRRQKANGEDAPVVDGCAEGSPEQSKAGAAGSKSGQRRRRKTGSSHDCRYIHQVPKIDLAATSGKCVLIDPGRRDLLFRMHESNTPENPQTYRYIRNQKAKESRSTRFRRIRKKAKHRCARDDIRAAENKLAQVANRTVDSAKYQCYVETWAMARPCLSDRQMRGWPRISNLQTKFGQDTVLVMGNRSAPMSQYHEPIRNKGMRAMLRKHGFQMYLLDENRTPKTCPVCCDGELYVQKVQNPRPFRRATDATDFCHGLLRCSNKKCLESVASDSSASAPRPHYWNRDLAAVLNFRHILTNLRENSEIPERPGPNEQQPAKRRRKVRKQEYNPNLRVSYR